MLFSRNFQLKQKVPRIPGRRTAAYKGQNRHGALSAVSRSVIKLLTNKLVFEAVRRAIFIQSARADELLSIFELEILK